MHRCYIKNIDLNLTHIVITDSHECHHMNHVLHLKKGDNIQVFNAIGQMANVALEAVHEEGIKGKIESVKTMTANGARIILACALSKRTKFEDIIEKATELGVDEIIPLQTARSEVIIKLDKAKEKMARFHRVAIAAAKQCGRGQVPKIHSVLNLDQAFQAIPLEAVKLFPSLHDHPMHIRTALNQVSRSGIVAIFIGPEGDFTDQELSAALKAGCLPVSLGFTVLRVDTAAISAVALARYLLRD